MWHHWPVWAQDILGWVIFIAWCVILYFAFVKPNITLGKKEKHDE